MADTTSCPDCGAENAVSQRFCGACGKSLERTCPSCEQANPAGFRFCGACGASLGRPVTVASHDGERRWATVVFADLSGYTSLAEGMDPEDVRQITDHCMDRLGGIVEAYGGTVVNVMGDGLMAAFGAPVAHEDDPERAVRAALEMQVCARAEAAVFGELPLRIGINTGEVMFAPVGRPHSRREHTLTGDTTNTASRLETAAPRGGILVGEETRRATKRVIAYEEIDPLRLKGKADAVPAWLALEAMAEPGARPLSELPIIGRARELKRLGTIWAGVVEEARPHLVTILGVAGIGKSRLATEVLAQAEEDGARTVRARSLPYGARSGYGAFAELIKEIVGIFEGDDSDEVRRKLEAAVGDLLGSDARRVASELGVLMGVVEEHHDIEKKTLYLAARRFVEGLARAGPVALFFEDIHWADQSLLELLEWLATRLDDVPVLFLTVARPELLEEHPRWGSGPASSTTLPLDRLPADACRRLAERVLGARTAREGAVAEVERASGGNPLFVEELSAWLGQSDRPDRPIPTSVQAMIAARLDALPASLRDVLLDASVAGETFWRGALQDPAAASDALDQLEGRDFLRRARISRIEGEEEYAFKHILIREIAYQTLPKATRRERHARVAVFLESAAIGAGSAATLAHHWRNAGDRERAVPYLIQAAERASRGWAKAEAVKFYAEALELLDRDDPRYSDLTRRRALARTMFMHAVLDAPYLEGRPDSQDR